jgi:hypothetical protein
VTREELERKIKADPRFTLVKRPSEGVIMPVPVKGDGGASSSLPARKKSLDLKNR